MRDGLSPFDALPGLATAFDEEAMREHLQHALFGEATAYTVERCLPTRPLYLPGEGCVLRYRLRASDESGTVLTPLVVARVFPSGPECAAYVRENLEPVAARMGSRPEIAPFAAPVAVVDRLSTALSVWPIDGELPTLVDATDPATLLEVFRSMLGLDAEGVRIELVSYRRRQRCALRYSIAGPDGETVLFGKVRAVASEVLADPRIEVLRARLAARGLALPRVLALVPSLGLALLEGLPGEAGIRVALKARLRGRPTLAAPTLEDLVDTCAAAAAAVHASGLALGPARVLESELAALRREVSVARQFVPGFADRADAMLGRIAALAEEDAPLERRLAHGDFNSGQLLFAGPSAALLDLDSLCRAEPALDLGTFLAHLRVETEALRRRASVSSALGEELAERFLCTYAAAAGVLDEERLRARTSVYEALALVRLAVRSQHGFEEARLDIATSLLDERLSAARV